jgi:hypothetical protein
MDIKPYFYFIGTTIFVPLWIILFVKKENRKDMLLIGTIVGILAVIVEHLYSRSDYWNPQFIFPNFPFESFYYGLIFGGISTELYELIFQKRNSLKKLHPNRFKILPFFILFTALCFLFFVDMLELKSTIAYLIPPLGIGLTVAIFRKDLFISQIWNGLFLTIITFIMFQILLLINPLLFEEYWYLGSETIYIIGVPLEELAFGFFVGFGLCNLYEFLFGYSLIKEK